MIPDIWLNEGDNEAVEGCLEDIDEKIKSFSVFGLDFFLSSHEAVYFADNDG